MLRGDICSVALSGPVGTQSPLAPLSLTGPRTVPSPGQPQLWRSWPSRGFLIYKVGQTLSSRTEGRSFGDTCHYLCPRTTPIGPGTVGRVPW